MNVWSFYNINYTFYSFSFPMHFLQTNYLGGIGINEAPIQMAIASGNLMQWTNNDGSNQGLMPIVSPSAPSYHNPSQMTAQGL